MGGRGATQLGWGFQTVREGIFVFHVREFSLGSSAFARAFSARLCNAARAFRARARHGALQHGVRS
eukprot:7398057-Lingulodinium_polyedra.AAC.1